MKLKLTRVRQRFEGAAIRDFEPEAARQISGTNVSFPAGSQIAIAVGSRGISNLARIVRATAESIRRSGARPFVIPAMGSHGGATAEGQREMLAALGVTEQSAGCEIRSSMEVIELSATSLEHKLYMDRHAFESDGTVLINRVKPHTDFHGAYESGLVKMAVIGLGKERQAFEMHRFGVRGLREFVPRAAREVFATGKVLLGLAIVENARDETAVIEAIPARQIMEREPALLELARANMPRLPVDDLDVLLVDQLGKNISGAGMDTNIIGRIRIRGEEEPAAPRIKSIAVTSLTPESHGNATGCGLADVVTRRLFDQADLPTTYKNIVTSGFLERGKIPVIAETPAEAMEIAMRGAGYVPPGRERIIRIRDTLHLEEMFVSNAVLEDLRGGKNIQPEAEPVEMFDDSGELRPW